MTIVADNQSSLLKDAAAPRPKQARITWFDGARGYLLTMMYLAHFSFTVGTPAIWLHHGRYLPVMDGEFFVLISGYVCALAYFGAYQRGGAVGAMQSVLSRLKWVYAYQVIVAVLMIMMFQGFGQTEVEPGRLGDFETPLWRQFLLAAQLLEMPPYLDILMLYMVLMLFIPLAFAALEAGWRWKYFAVLAGLWLFVQSGLAETVNEAVASATHYNSVIGVKGYFQPLSYAIVFYGAFFLGYLAKKRVDISEMGAFRLRPATFYLCLAMLGGFVALTVGFKIGVVPMSVVMPERNAISLQGLTCTAAASYLIWSLISRKGVPAGLNWLSGIIRAFFNFSIFRLLGRNSLFVYSMHVVALFLAAWCVIILGLQDNQIAKLIAMVGGYGLIVGLAVLKNRFLPNLP